MIYYCDSFLDFSFFLCNHVHLSVYYCVDLINEQYLHLDDTEVFVEFRYLLWFPLALNAYAAKIKTPPSELVVLVSIISLCAMYTLTIMLAMKSLGQKKKKGSVKKH